MHTNLTKISLAATLAFALTGCGSDNKVSTETIDLENTAEKQTYAFGQKVGSHVNALLAQGKQDSVNPDILTKGFADALTNKGQFSKDEVAKLSKVFTEKLYEQQANKVKALEEENLAASEAYLNNNKLASDIITTNSGLQYKTTKVEPGNKPTDKSVIRVAYEGRLIDGTIIDKRDADSTDVLFMEKVIPGWQEGLQMMSVGSKYTFYIHPDLAYGTQKSPNIPANSALIFDVELIEIIKP